MTHEIVPEPPEDAESEELSDFDNDGEDLVDLKEADIPPTDEEVAEGQRLGEEIDTDDDEDGTDDGQG